MRARGACFAGISLLVMPVVTDGAAADDAAAMEQNGAIGGFVSSPELAPEPTPEFSFPAFLSADRLPLLQAAWRSHASTSASETAEQAPAMMHGDAMSAARAAMQRIGSATRQAPVVRQAAEELSRRFSAFEGGVATEDSGGGAVVPTAISEMPSAEATTQDAAEAAAVEAGGAAGFTGPATITATSAIPQAEMRPQSAQLDEAPPLQSTRKLTKIPPLPLRAPVATATNTSIASTPRSNAGSVATRMVTVTRPEARSEAPGRGDIFPHYMRAFGWDDQP
jgi:hypothetical protein